MKKFTKSLLIASLLPVLALSACKKDEPEAEKQNEKKEENKNDNNPTVDLNAPYSLGNYWEGNREEDYYKITSVDDGFKVEYTDVNEYRYIGRSFSYDDVSSFSRFKVLHFRADLNKSSGGDEVLIKIEYPEGTEDSKELRFNLAPTTKTYEADVSQINWSVVPTLYFFFNPGGSELGSGVATFYDFSLRVSADSSAENIGSLNSERYTVYNGSDEYFKVTDYWYSASKNYSISEPNANGERVVEYDKKEGDEWTAVYARIKGSENIGKFKQLHVRVSGATQKQVLVKLEGVVAKEQWVTFSGSDDDISIELPAGLTTSNFTVRFMPEGGSINVQGSFTVKQVYFSTIPAENSTQNIFNSDSDGVDFTAKWYGDATYSYDYTTPYVRIDWTAEKGDWESCKTLLGGSKVNEYQKLVISFKGTQGQKVLFKLALGNVEKWVDSMTGEDETTEIIFADGNNYSIANEFLVFGNGGQNGSAGYVQINSVKLAKAS